jgi:large exoprotein involved in heme utilization and adhesion
VGVVNGQFGVGVVIGVDVDTQKVTAEGAGARAVGQRKLGVLVGDDGVERVLGDNSDVDAAVIVAGDQGDVERMSSLKDSSEVSSCKATTSASMRSICSARAACERSDFTRSRVPGLMSLGPKRL